MINQEFIPWSEFSAKRIKFINDKPCCIIVTHKKRKYVLKEFINDDLFIIDEFNNIFDLWSLNMKRIVSDKKLIKENINILNIND